MNPARSGLPGYTWKVLNAILRCRTAAPGGHVNACLKCGHKAVSFNSCPNRHCPKCQANARDRWLEAREKELQPTRYVHVVFKLPRQLSPLALQNKHEIYSLLFRASAEVPVDVLKEVFRGEFVDGLKKLHAEHKLSFHGTLAVLQNPKAFAAWLRPLFRSQWVVYSKRPFGGAQHALRCLGQYTIAWRSQTIDSWHLPTAWLLFAGAIPLTRTRSV